MIDTRIDQKELIRIIKESAALYLDAYQVSQRLHDLLETTLCRVIDSLKLKYSGTLSSVKIRKMALTDSRYIDILKKYLENKSNYLHSKIIYDTHMMLLESRRSMRSLNSHTSSR